jgi:hypothetical protein
MDRRFRAAHRSAVKVVAEYALHRRELNGVCHRRGAVGVDVVDVLGLQASLLERHLHFAGSFPRADQVAAVHPVAERYLVHPSPARPAV